MKISIATNLTVLRVQRRVSTAAEQLRLRLEQLSTGSRISRVSDDPVGLALATVLRNQTRLASTALRNASDGLSAFQITDSALQEIRNVLTQMAELAQQSMNPTVSNKHRSLLQAEFLALGSEIQHIAETTTYNGFNLLSNSRDMVLHVGYHSESTSKLTLHAVSGALEDLQLASMGSEQMNYGVIGDTEPASRQNASEAFTAVMRAIDELDTTRGGLGADGSRLASSVSHLGDMRESLETAESRIREVDVAEATLDLVQLQMSQDAGFAILAQAAQQPAVILELLAQTPTEERKKDKEWW